MGILQPERSVCPQSYSGPLGPIASRACSWLFLSAWFGGCEGSLGHVQQRVEECQQLLKGGWPVHLDALLTLTRTLTHTHARQHACTVSLGKGSQTTVKSRDGVALQQQQALLSVDSGRQ